MTASQQLAALQRLAEIVGALVLEIKPGKYGDATQAYVSRFRIRELEEALITAGYDMPTVRKRYKAIVKAGRLKRTLT